MGKTWENNVCWCFFRKTLVKIIVFFWNFPLCTKVLNCFRSLGKSIKLLLVDFLAMFDLMTLVFWLYLYNTCPSLWYQRSMALPSFNYDLAASHGWWKSCGKANVMNPQNHHVSGWTWNHPQMLAVYGSQGFPHYWNRWFQEKATSQDDCQSRPMKFLKSATLRRKLWLVNFRSEQVPILSFFHA